MFGTESPLLTKKTSDGGGSCVWTDSSDDSFPGVEEVEDEDTDSIVVPAANFDLEFDETIENSLDEGQTVEKSIISDSDEEYPPSPVFKSKPSQSRVSTSKTSVIDLTAVVDSDYSAREFFKAVEVGLELARRVREHDDEDQLTELSRVCIEIFANFP